MKFTSSQCEVGFILQLMSLAASSGAHHINRFDQNLEEKWLVSEPEWSLHLMSVAPTPKPSRRPRPHSLHSQQYHNQTHFCFCHHQQNYNIAFILIISFKIIENLSYLGNWLSSTRFTNEENVSALIEGAHLKIQKFYYSFMKRFILIGYHRGY